MCCNYRKLSPGGNPAGKNQLQFLHTSERNHRWTSHRMIFTRTCWGRTTHSPDETCIFVCDSDDEMMFKINIQPNYTTSQFKETTELSWTQLHHYTTVNYGIYCNTVTTCGTMWNCKRVPALPDLHGNFRGYLKHRQNIGISDRYSKVFPCLNAVNKNGKKVLTAFTRAHEFDKELISPLYTRC